MTRVPRRVAARGVAAAVLVATLAVAAWARLADVSRVLGRGEVVPVDGDSAYHLRRILYAVEHFPSLPTVDPMMNWPSGGTCPWADGFDLLGAALARAAGGLRSRPHAELAAALLPVLLGLAVAWAAMNLAQLVARRRLGARVPGVAAAAGLVAALLPQAVASSRFGRMDHHVAEALSMLLLAGWALRRPATGASARCGARYEAAGAGAVAFACWMFTGGELYVAIAAALLLWRALRERDARWLGSGAPALLAGAAAAALLAVPAMRQHGRLASFQLPSLLQPALVALAGVAVASAILVARRLPRAGLPARTVVLAAMTLGAALTAAVAWPGAAGELVAGLRGWLLRGDPWLASVDEFQPLWRDERGLVGSLDFFLGAPGVVAPALVVVGGAWAARRSGPRGLAFAGVSVALLGLTFVQNRFGRVFAPFLAVNTALALEAGGWLALRALRRPRALAAVTALAAVVLALADPRLRGMLRPGGPRALPPEAAAAIALRLAPGEPAEESPGVVAPWGFGHLISLLSGRPVVANGFGTYLDAPTFWELERLASMDPLAFDAWMARRRVGYVVTGAAYVGGRALAASQAGLVLDLASMRTQPLSPLMIAGSGVPDAGVRHLEHLMPLFASEHLTGGLAFPLPALWAYERVPGARIVGRSAPGLRVVLEIPFRERRRPHVYKAWSDVGADGRWEIVVPLPTALARASLQTAALASVRAGEGAAASVAIPEEAVRRGAELQAPPLPGASR